LNRVATEDIQDGAVTPQKLYAGGTETTYIWVSAADGNDTTGTGSVTAPYATITKAFSVVTAARNTIYVLPGTYTEASILTWPNVNNVQLIGLDWGGNVTITAPADGGAEVILINPTFTSATLSAFIENVLIYHGNSKIGVKIDNAHMGSRKLMVYLLTVPTYGSGNSVDMSHTVTGQAIRLYMVNCDEVTGLVNLLTTTTDDRFRFRNCTLIGGVTNTGAIASEITFIDSVLLTSGLTTDGANVLTLVGSVYRTSTTGVYTPAITGAQLAAAAGITGSQIASTTVAAGNILGNTITTSQISTTAGILGSQLGQGTTHVLTGTVAFGDTTGAITGMTIPAKSLVTDVIAVPAAVFNGATFSISIEDSGAPAGFLPAMTLLNSTLTVVNVAVGADPSTRGPLLWNSTTGATCPITAYYNSTDAVHATISKSGSPSTGSLKVYCVYVALA
jgi:hypothetical protein